MTTLWPKLIEAIHQSPVTSCITTTGAGASAVSALMSVPGCSKTLLEANIPYHADVSATVLDMFPSKYASMDVSRVLAQTAFNRAINFSARRAHVVGIGATAAIATNRARRGADCVYVTCWSCDRVHTYSIENIERVVSRAEQELVVGSLIIRALADAANIARVPIEGEPLLCDGEVVNEVTHSAAQDDVIALLLSGRVSSMLYNRHGVPRTDCPPFSAEEINPARANYLLYPGSFAPLHWGHKELARAASVVVQQRDESSPRKPVILTYEISASIVGKGDLNIDEVKSRVEQFTSGNRRVALTNAKLFIDKARMFRHHGLIVGVDTAIRVLDTKYYEDSAERMIEAMREIESCGCYFIVGGRAKGEEWIDMSHVNIPPQIRHMFIPIKPEDFRVDISSTDLRRRRCSTPDASPATPAAV